MRFLSPLYLWLLVPVALIAVAYVLQQRRRSAYAVRFASLPMLARLVPRRPGWRRHLPAVLILLVLGLLALSTARPEMQVKVPRETATVIVTLDVSTSMQATDVEPSRLEAASEAATRFVKGLPKGFDVGLVTFAGQTSVRAAPTGDRDAVVQALEDLPLAGRTAIGEGVFTSLDQVAAAAKRPGQKGVPAHIVLLSDGTNTFGRSTTEAAQAAVNAKVPVSTIAYGTPEGTLERNGRLLAVPVDEETLAELAENTDGSAYTAESSDELNDVYDDIQSAIGFRMEPREVAPYASAIALALGLLAGALSLRWFSRLP